MKATILPENIIPYLPLLSKLLPSHTQVPILSNILIEAGDKGLVLKSTDLELGAEIKIPAKIEKEGSITVPGKEFLESISSLPKDKITLSLEDDKVTLVCRGNTVSFNTIPATEFPQLYKEKGDETVRFTSKEFEEIFSYLAFSVSLDEARPQLTGIFIDVKDNGVNFVSTDGYRMSINKVKQKKKIEDSLIIAVGLVNEVSSIKGEGEIVFYVNKKESHVMCTVGDVVVVGRMIEGAFPDYERVLPKDAKTTVDFDREELLRNVRLASVFAKDSSNIATVEIEGEKIKISTRSQGVGEGEAVIDCVKKGEDNKIAFNIKYLMDLLKTIKEERITLKLNSSTEPALFEVKERNYLHVIMPIQVD